MSITMIKTVSKNQFHRYLEVQRDGQYNMYSPLARKEANLDVTIWAAIMENYNELLDKFGPLDQYDIEEG